MCSSKSSERGLGEIDSASQGGGLVLAFALLVVGIAVGDDAGAGLEVRHPLAAAAATLLVRVDGVVAPAGREDDRAQSQRDLHVPVERHRPKSPAVGPPPSRFQLVDQLHRLHLFHPPVIPVKMTDIGREREMNRGSDIDGAPWEHR